MSIVTRKAQNDIAFIEGESARPRTNKPDDWQDCEILLKVYIEAVNGLAHLLGSGEQLDESALNELSSLAHRFVHVAPSLEARLEAQQGLKRIVEQANDFRESVKCVSQMADQLLAKHEALEASEWAKVDKIAPSNPDLLASARVMRAPQEWYDEKTPVE